MRRVEKKDIEKVTINLFKGDTKRLKDLHPLQGYGTIIRNLVRAHLKRVNSQTTSKIFIEGEEYE